jgi:hypothetical protein
MDPDKEALTGPEDESIMVLKEFGIEMPPSAEGPPQIGPFLRSLREGMRISLRRMADELAKDGWKISDTQIFHIEKGNDALPPGFLAQYVETLNRIHDDDGVRLGRPRPKQTQQQ